MSPETPAQSSTRYARETTRAECVWRIVLIGLFCLISTMPPEVAAEEPATGSTIEFDIPQQRADLALTQFAEQANLTLLFPFDGVRDRMANALTGEYTLDEAIDVLLAGTGLTPTFKNALVLDIAIDSDPTIEEDSMNTKRKAGVVAVLAGVLAGGVNAQEPTVTETEIQTTVVTGIVTDARTGANLRGAKVTIEETGQWTSTGSLGKYRFSSVPIGDFTITVSFLGYDEQSATVGISGSAASRDFALTAELEEIVVFGQRSSRALSLNRERTAANVSTVLSADVLGNFGGSTVSDSLRRAPGVAFVPNSETGSGAQVIIRGLSPDFNQIRLNGLRVAEGSGIRRSPDLSGLLTESIESVTISKTLLPSQDTNGAGGLVEIETKSPLDREARFANFLLEGTERGGSYGNDMQASMTLSGIFGQDESLGLSISGQYFEQDLSRINYAAQLRVGQYLPAGISSTNQIDPRSTFPFEPGVDLAYPASVAINTSSTKLENTSLTASLEKQVADHTNLRLDYTRADIDSTNYSRTSSIGGIVQYAERPIDSLGGENRFALITFGLPFGPIAIQSMGASAERDRSQINDSLSFRGETNVDTWSFKYSAGFSRGKSEVPRRVAATLRSSGVGFFVPLDQLQDSITSNLVGGSIVSLFNPIQPGTDPGFIFPGFTEERISLHDQPDSFDLVFGLVNSGFGENDRKEISSSIRKDFNDRRLKNLELGFAYEDSESSSVPGSSNFNISSNAVPLSELGIDFEPGILRQAGLAIDANDILTTSSIDRIIDNAGTWISDGSVVGSEIANDARFRSEKRREQEGVAYVQGQVDFGRLQLVGGVRVSDVEFSGTFLTFPVLIENGVADTEFSDEFTQLVTSSAGFTDWLPRLSANFRIDENNILRFGYFRTVSRPRLGQLSSTSTVTLNLDEESGPQGTQPLLTVNQGNPFLKPATTDSFDVSFERYAENIGVLKAGVFYKNIDNLLDTNTSVGGQEVLPSDLFLPNAPDFNNLPSNIFVEVNQPVNSSASAEIWGAEIAYERQFNDVFPGAWGGLGVYANATYTDSSKTEAVSSAFDPSGTVFVKGVSFDGSPRYSGTAAVTYNKSGFDAVLAYSIQDRRLASYGAFGLGRFDDEFDTLDFRVEYYLERGAGTYRVFFEANDILKGDTDPSISQSLGGMHGAPTYENVSATYLGGRQFLLGVAATF